ncbi:hypothetical protein [Runella aurantiaca]|uniref:Uncharacterized protein n=1 Tax=Runella aurantiaca TaxID=2282308 RepID=A0A369IDJ0_9BACT|nr:hypothetical protein [Runella aurantiaca]RDB07839.1 hypothetical protein DVG78_01950 [Runella aurantiaca]
MTQKIDFKFLLGFSELFPKEKPHSPFQYYLQQLPKYFILDICAELLAIFPNDLVFSDDKNFIKYFFKISPSLCLKLFGQIKYPITPGLHPTYIIGNHFAVLRIAEYAATMHDTVPGFEISYETGRLEFLKSLAVINEEIRQKDDYLEDISEDLNERERYALALISNSIAYHDILNFDYAGQILCGIYRAKQLFSFFKDHQDSKIDTSGLLSRFLNRHGMDNPADFLNDLLYLLTFIPFHEGNKNLAFKISDNSNQERNRKFLEEFVLKDNLEYDPIFDDFPTLRSRPLYKTAPDTYKILCGAFLIQKVFKGLYFSIRDVLSSYKYETKKIREIQLNSFRQMFTEEFSEKYLLHNIIEEIYGQKYIRFSDKNLAINGAPDYYFRSGNTLFLFESKDFLLKATIKQSYKPNEVLSELRKSLYVSGDKPKAAKQLANSIKKIINSDWKFDKGLKNPSNIKIYPIIIIHDSSYDVPGLSYWVNNWFNTELEGINRVKIKPVLLIPIDALIKLIPLLKGTQPHQFSELLENYIEKQKDSNDILTFSSYLASSDKNKKKENEYYRKTIKSIAII